MQKTAYNMLISDWSSDVCSSDLHLLSARARDIGGQYRHIDAPVVARDEGAFFGRGRGAARRAFRGTGGGGGARPDRPGTLDFGEARRSSDPRESGGAEPFLPCRGAGGGAARRRRGRKIVGRRADRRSARAPRRPVPGKGG